MGDWIEKSISEFGTVVTGSTPSTKILDLWDGEIPFYSPADFSGSPYCLKTERTITEKGANTGRIIPKNSIMFTCIGSIGKTAISGKIGITNQQINTITVDHGQFDFRFIYYLLLNNKSRFINYAPMTTIQIINKSKFEQFDFLIPKSKSEQSTIATILSTVDAAIEKTEQLIAKYERIKTGLMQDLLTRGIDEQGNIRSEETHAFKDSPLGRIPVGWEVERLGNLAAFISGKAWSTKLLTEHGLKIIRISNLHKPDFPYWRYDGAYTEDMIVNTGDILFSWAGVASSIDCVQYLGSPALLNQHIYNLKFDDDNIKVFTHRYIRWFLPELRKEIEGGAGQLHLTKGKIQGILVPMPTKKELSLINESIERITKLVDLEKKGLVKMKNKKTALMQDLLTGKVRVDNLLKENT